MVCSDRIRGGGRVSRLCSCPLRSLVSGGTDTRVGSYSAQRWGSFSPPGTLSDSRPSLANYKDEALHLRNKLLLFRFRKLHAHTPGEHFVDRTIEPRLNQVFVPLLSIIPDPSAQEDIRELARQYHRELVTERSMDIEAQILEIIKDMLTSPLQSRLTIKELTSWFIDRYGEEYERKITTKWIGFLVRKRLNLRTQKSHGVFPYPVVRESKIRPTL
jgi:hypothetical protein